MASQAVRLVTVLIVRFHAWRWLKPFLSFKGFFTQNISFVNWLS